MQQRARTSQAKRGARTYSSEALFVRMALGILLVALGTLSFVSMVSATPGVVFNLAREYTKPVAGELCLIFPVFVVWGGALLALSSRRQTSFRAFVLLLLVYLFVLAIVDLVTFVWDAVDRDYFPLMEYIPKVNARDFNVASWDGYPEAVARALSLFGKGVPSGGILGAALAWPVYKGLGMVGGVAVLSVAILVLLLVLARVDLRKVAASMRGQAQRRGEMRVQREAERQAAEAAARQEEARRQAMRPPAPAPAYERRAGRTVNPGVVDTPVPAQAYDRRQPAPMPMRQGGDLYDETIVTDPQPVPGMDVAGSLRRAQERKKPAPQPVPAPAPAPGDDLPWEEDEETARQLDSRRSIVKPIRFDKPRPEPAQAPAPAAAQNGTPDFPQVKAPNMQREPRMSGQRLDEPDLNLPPRKAGKPQQLQMQLAPTYAYPTLDMLKLPKKAIADNRQEDERRARILEETLASFGISAQVEQVTHGPTVTRFELELASGINVKRITGLTDTIAMNLAAGGVRIEAPIPNKALVGVEVPNKEIIPVTLREVLESDEMGRADSPLSFALGKDIAGAPIVCDLAKLPHLLIAGATGSGKSVCINSIICSLLFRTSPRQVRLLLVDPKVVELQCYNNIPHLLTPVVSDPHKAAAALNWAVTEMMERYQKFKERNVRGITGYNSALKEGEEAMHRIVIIIDELADLMMASKREVEESICRIAQLARAAGIHLVVATQRPSVNVITGLIKNNLQSRIAFAVPTSIDARTIMERAGAEKLLGKGDMLYNPAGALAPLRVQGSFVSDDEVNKVADFIRAHSTPDYDPNIQELLDQTNSPTVFAPDAAEPTGQEEEDLDELLSQAIEMAIQEGQTSISMLQRKMRIGYARAGRLIDEMTNRGIISQAAGAKPRKVLISREDFQQMETDE